MLSLKLLTPAEIDFFSSLSICAKDSFSLQTAMAVTSSNKETAERTQDYLHRLSFLNYSLSNANRFVFHPLIHLFAKELAVERSLQDLAAERHAKFFIEFVKSHDLNDPSISHFVAEELEDILLAAEWLHSQNKVDYELASKLESFFQETGLWNRSFDLMTESPLFAEHMEDWAFEAQLPTQQSEYHSLFEEWQKSYERLKPLKSLVVESTDLIKELYGGDKKKKC